MIGRDLSKKIVERSPGISARMGVVTGSAVGPPRTVSATIGGVTVSDIPILDHVDATIGVSIWFLVLGPGKILGIGAIGG